MQKTLQKLSADTIFLVVFCTLFVFTSAFLVARHDTLLAKGGQGLISMAFQDPHDTTNDTILLRNHGTTPVTATLVFFPPSENPAEPIEQVLELAPYEEKIIPSNQDKSKKIEVRFTTNDEPQTLTLYRK